MGLGTIVWGLLGFFCGWAFLLEHGRINLGKNFA
mgnify:CR=1 FL=1